MNSRRFSRDKEYIIWDVNDTERVTTVYAENAATAIDIFIERSGEVLLEVICAWKFRTDRSKYFICLEAKQ